MSSSRAVRRTAAETELAAQLLLAAVTLGCLWGAGEAQVRQTDRERESAAGAAEGGKAGLAVLARVG